MSAVWAINPSSFFFFFSSLTSAKLKTHQINFPQRCFMSCFLVLLTWMYLQMFLFSDQFGPNQLFNAVKTGGNCHD